MTDFEKRTQEVLEESAAREVCDQAGVVLANLNCPGQIVISGRTAAVERGSVVSIVSATGTINPVVSVQVGSQVSGMIKSLHADFNSRVKAGDIVVFHAKATIFATGSPRLSMARAALE